MNGTTSPRRLTRADVVASFNHSVHNHWSVTWFGRPIAFSLTPYFYNHGWTANQVTGLRTIIGMAGCVAVMFLPLGAYAAALLFYTSFIFDCVDGNIARLHDSASYFGKFIDGLTDLVHAGLMPFAAGIGVWWAYDEPIYLLIGALATIMTLANQYVRTRLSFTREWMVRTSGPIESAAEDALKLLRARQSSVAAIYVNGSFLAVLLLLVPVVGPKWYILALIPTGICCDAAWLTLSLIEARVLLDRKRRSIHLATGYAPASAPVDVRQGAVVQQDSQG